MKNFKTGVNFGCWISQYSKLDYAMFRKMTTKDDVLRVRDWGFDHVRLPFDYPLLVDDSDLYTFKPEGVAFLDDLVTWTKDAGVSLLLDLHWAPGYRFQDKGANTLFETEEMQKVFISMWTQLAERYKGEGDTLAFDLLNEVAEVEYLDPWIALAQRTVKAIRDISVDRDIIYGGAYYNSVHMLDKLPVADDPHIVYNFHYYEPILFTHQFASWSEINRACPVAQEYPADFTNDLLAFVKENPQYESVMAKYQGMRCDRATLARDLQQAADFQAKHGVMTYCGEYGAYDKAPQESRINWLRDVTDLFNQHHIGRALWNYLGGGFGLYDWEKQVETEPEIVKIITKTW